MSVINQMLKDLDKRQEENPAAAHVPVVVTNAKNNTPLAVFFTVLITLILVALVYLYTENQSLKSESITEPVELANTLTASRPAQIVTPSPVNETTQEAEATDSPPEKELPHQQAMLSTNEQPATLVEPSKSIEPQQSVNKTETVSDSVSVVAKNEKESTGELSQKEIIETKPALSISRKKLSPDELSATKMTQAQQAVIDNNMPLAEQLFEDILLISPSHVAARKQVAA